jgi:hypothetical protein
VRALVVVSCLAGTAHAQLPTIESERPPALAVSSDTYGLRIERVEVAVRSAPEATFVTIDVTGKTGAIALDVPAGTRIVGLGVDGPDGRVWGRALPAKAAHAQLAANGGSLLVWNSDSAGQGHVTITVAAPAKLEVALHFPPLQRLAIATDPGAALLVAVESERVQTQRKRSLVLDLEDIAGTTGDLAAPHATSDVSIVAAPTPAIDFMPAAAASRSPVTRDLDKAIIRRRLQWFRPTLRGCYLREAQWDGANNVKPLRGGAVISFMIVSDGSVEWARTSETDLPYKVNACIVDQVMRWDFPQADGNVQVNYPVSFDLAGW